MMNEDSKQGPMPEGAPAPKEGGAPKQMAGDEAEKVAQGISEKAVGLMNGMQELGFVLSELGVAPEQLEELAGQFNAFLQTIQTILGGGEGQKPEMEGNQPVDANGGAGGIPYDQGMATAGKNKARPMVG
jgi:hypothetical protein